MATTKEKIVTLGDKLIRDKGYNAFSYYDIAPALKVNNAAIHYHFPAKTDLGEAVVDCHSEKFTAFTQSITAQSEIEQLKSFLELFHRISDDNRVCLVGALAPELPSLNKSMRQKLTTFVKTTLDWLTAILERGRKKGDFNFSGTARTRALMVITNIFAWVQISRITGEKDFQAIKTAILNDISR